MDAALRRRNYVLERMAEEGFITEAEADAAKQEADRRCAASRRRQHSVAPYFLEEVRKELEALRREAAVRERPRVQTALDCRCRRRPTRARRGLRRVDKRARLPQAAAQRDRRRAHARRVQARRAGTGRCAAGDIVPAVVTRRRRRRRSSRAPARCAVTIDSKGYAWTRKTTPAQLVTRRRSRSRSRL